MLPCVCSRTSVTHLAIASCATFWFLPHFDVISDLLLKRCTATWNLFVNYTMDRVKRTFWLVQGSLWLNYRRTNDVMSREVLRAQITAEIFKNLVTLREITDIKKMCKAKRYHLAVRVYYDNAQRRSKRGKNIGHATHLRLVEYFFVLTAFWRHDLCVIRVNKHGQMDSSR